MERSTEPRRPVRLSVLIVNWNDWDHLQRCLQSIRHSDRIDCEVLVVDNGSGDGSVERLKRSFPKVRIQANATNVGHTRGVNQGFGLVDGEYILVLDSDTELSSGAIDLLIEFMRDHEEVSLVVPRTLNLDGTIQETARDFPTVWNGLFGRQSLLTRWFPRNRFARRYLRRDALDFSEPFPVECVSAAAMLFPRALLERVGPWDESYPGYFVDNDWCMRLKNMGERIECVPAARITHGDRNRRGRRRDARRILMFHRGAYRFYLTHYTAGRLDPRAVFAAAALAGRALLLIAFDRIARVAEPAPRSGTSRESN